MSWIPFYADETDFRSILKRLDAGDEIAFILAHGRSKWIARARVPDLPDGAYCLWHIPGGPLPLLSNTPGKADGVIMDPFAGWTEQRRGADASMPFFGSVPNVFTLRKATRGVETAGSIGLSSLGWLGNRYRSLGLGARRETERWWRRMRSWVQQAASPKIPRWDAENALEPEIWVFPSARRSIEAGLPRDANSHL